MVERHETSSAAGSCPVLRTFDAARSRVRRGAGEFRAISFVSGGLLAAGSVWALLKIGYPFSIQMPLHLSLAFLFAGSSLCLLVGKREQSRARAIGRVFACIVGMIGLLALCEHLFNVDLSIHGILAGGRTLPTVATDLLLAGMALLLLDQRLPRGDRPAQLFSLIVALLSVPALFLPPPGESLGSNFTAYLSMGPAAAAGFVLLSVGLLCARTDRGPESADAADFGGLTAARNASLVIVAVPLGLGCFVRLTGSRLGLHSSEFGLALFAAVNILTIAGLVWAYAHSIEAGRRRASCADESLRDSEERYRSVTESTPDAVVCADARGRITGWNRGAETMFGHTAREALEKPLVELMPERFRKVHCIAFGRAVSTCRTCLVGKTIDLVGLRKDGTEFPIELSLSRWTTGRGTFFGGIIRDVTQRKQLEGEYRQSQKMEAVGRLAGGIAHDFNNLLTVINGYGDLALKRSDVGDALRSQLVQVRAAGERAAGLTRQLLAFGRKQVLQPRILDVNEVVRDVATMLRRVLGEDIELVADLAPGLGHVRADRGQMEQVLMSLAVNARDAMPEGGTLTIATAGVGGASGRRVRLSVSDTGCGMDDETLKHLFEPFFTTKAPGKGTGLGLATVYGIVHQSEGRIAARSEPGRGATFEIELPQIDEPVVAEPPAPAAAVRGTETILVVEDEPAVRELVASILRAEGYAILTAAGGAEAIEVCDRRTSVIRLLVTDVVMPGMGGREVAHEVSPLHPEMKILYMSGHSEEAVRQHGVLQPGAAFLSKPFTPAVLAAKVREVLDEAGPPISGQAARDS